LVTTDALPTHRLTARELSVWRTFLRAYAIINARLEHDLVDAHELPLPWYEVLLHLAEAPVQRMRMTDLADRVLLSRSGLTRLVDRLESEGLVKREACPSDARGTFTVLTRTGHERLSEAAPTYLHGIASYVADPLSGPELDTLHELLVRLLDAVGGDSAEAIPARR
jgi:DNA-binding MarR family transcriptional regulator